MLSLKKKKLNKRNHWKKEEEDLLKQWADKAKCYHWLHNKSRELYQKKNAWFTIPVIIISTITGTANFAQDRFSDSAKEYLVISIGTLSIIAGIITTVYQFLKISEINEGHRVALLSWSKFYVNIESELSRHPLDRTNPSELIKISKDEFNRLLEISPFIPKKILKEFNKKFKNASLTKPEIGNNINPMSMFKMDESSRQKMINELNQDVLAQNQDYLKKVETKQNQIEKFRQSFFEINSRYPSNDEIKKNLKYTNLDFDSFSDISVSDNSDVDNKLNKSDSLLDENDKQNNSDNSDNSSNNSDINKKYENESINENISISISQASGSVSPSTFV